MGWLTSVECHKVSPVIEIQHFLYFSELEKAYANLSEKQIEQLLKDKSFVEICHENAT